MNRLDAGMKLDTSRAGCEFKKHGQRNITKILLVILLFCVPGAAQTSVRCFFQNGVVNGGQSYWGNAVTHNNPGKPPAAEVVPAYQVYGNNAVIFDGPVVHIGTPCLLTSVTYLTGLKPDTDPYQRHFICEGSGASNFQGATITATLPATAGSCAPGDAPFTYVNTYDVGLYCVSNTTGECTYGQLYCNVGPVPYYIAAPGPYRLATFNCKQGVVVLPQGDYGVMMATNCDNGSTVASGSSSDAGFGDSYCLTGMGESGPFGAGGVNGTFSYGPEIYAWKYFVFPWGPWQTKLKGHCLLYDPMHDNAVGLPATLTAYDNGGCSMVDTGRVMNSPFGEAPHTIGFTWWADL